jgi:tetratricopeptide (TPR) repeat protein
MLGRFLPARRVSGRSVASALAVAVTLATAATGPAAHAQNRARNAQAEPKASYSPNFVKVYQPVAAIVNAQGGDLAAAKAQVPGVVAAIVNADDRFAAGNLVLQIGTKLNDRVLQRQGLELMVASGKIQPDQLGQAQFVLGGLAYDANDFAAAKTALEAARAAGYQDESLPALLAESYFKSNQAQQGLEFLKGAIAQRIATGTAVPETWLRRGLQVAYENKLAPQANEWSALLASTTPSPTNWAAALQVVNAVNQLDPQVRLDLLRLMALTNSMTDKREYIAYIEAADPRVMSNEVTKVLQAGLAAGVFKSSDPDYLDFKRVADQRVAADRADAPKLVAEAKSAANGTAALNAGDVLYSLGEFAQAEQMYQLALTKGGADKDKALTRLGIAQAQQGKKAEAKATFAQVSGVRATVARMWQAYLDAKA